MEQQLLVATHFTFHGKVLKTRYGNHEGVECIVAEFGWCSN